jgi:hypothetical protein
MFEQVKFARGADRQGPQLIPKAEIIYPSALWRRSGDGRSRSDEVVENPRAERPDRHGHLLARSVSAYSTLGVLRLLPDFSVAGLTTITRSKG